MRVAWLTDLHLDFVDARAAEAFFDRLAAGQPDAVLLSGDISQAGRLTADLEEIGRRAAVPVYFVLGNHDFYNGSIAEVRRQAGAVCGSQPNLVYLTQQLEPIELAPEVGLIGHDGWADARVGDYDRSSVMLNDYRLIHELRGYGKAERRRVLELLGDEAAGHIGRLLPAALERYAHVVVVTHVPPLREACWHEGRISDDEWSPHFTCLAVGQVLLEIAPRWPHRRITVLCGHTHSAGEARPAANLHILTGGAEYGRPRVERVLDLDELAKS